MARPGITYIDVAKVAAQLIEQQQRPSIEAVRRILGTGSNSTINQHLREWRKTHGDKIELEQGLPETLLVAVRGIYEAICAQGNDKIEQLTAQYKQTIDDLTLKIESLEKSNQQGLNERSKLTGNLTEMQVEKSELENLNHQLNKRIDEKTTENHLLTERLHDKQSEIKRLIEQIKNFQNSLNHYRDTLRDERIVEKGTYENELSKLKSSLHTQEKTTREAQEEIIALKQKIQYVETERSEGKIVLAETLEHNKNLEREKHTFEITYQKLEEGYQSILEELKSLKQDSTKDKDKLGQLIINLEKYKERASIYENNLKKAEDIIADLRDKNLFLAQKKNELANQLSQTLKEES